MNCNLEELHKLPVELVQQFVKTGISKAIPESLQNYIKQLNKASEVHEIEPNITRASKKLREFFPDISLPTARNRIYDALNYFHLNSTVRPEAWSNYYADRFEDLAKMAVADNNWTEARRCWEKAKQYRMEASQMAINPEDFKPHIFLIDPRVTPDMLGVKEKNLKFMWNDTEELIDKMPINSQDKEKIKREAAENLGIEDVDFEEMEQDE